MENASDPGLRLTPEAGEKPDLLAMIRHNQDQWRERRKGLLVLSSPIEVKGPELFGFNPLDKIYRHFGRYINPVYREAPPILGVSALMDTTVLEPGKSFYMPVMNYDHTPMKPWSEAITEWLTTVALDNDPMTAKYGFLAHGEIQNLLGDVKQLVKSREFTVSQINEAFAKYHFHGDPTGMDRIISKISNGKFSSMEQYRKSICPMKDIEDKADNNLTTDSRNNAKLISALASSYIRLN